MARSRVGSGPSVTGPRGRRPRTRRTPTARAAPTPSPSPSRTIRTRARVRSRTRCKCSPGTTSPCRRRSSTAGSRSCRRWNFGDGTATSSQANPSHTYSAGGSYTVTLTVTDNQGAQNSVTHSVAPSQPNVAPVVNAGPDDHALTGLLYSFTWSFSDGNHNGPWSYTIDWGDGSTSSGNVANEGSFSAGHTYIIVLPRSFTITVTVTDASEASGSDLKAVSVTLL